MTMMMTTRELFGAGVPLVEALGLALRPPEFLLRPDGSPMRRMGAAEAVAGGNWYWVGPVPGWEGFKTMPDHLMLIGCGACRADGRLTQNIAVDRENFEEGAPATCHRCGATLCRYGTFV